MLRILLVLTLVTVARPGVAGGPSFVHVQTDRPSYRVGETVWFRAHSRASGELTVRLLAPDGSEVERMAFDADQTRRAGRFFVDDGVPGGTWLIEAVRGDRVAHSVPLEVFDLELPELDLSLSVLNDVHYAGERLTATFRALTLDGDPVRGARVDYLATFGDVRIRDVAGKTDADGRVIVRLQLPNGLRTGGHLAVGVATKKGTAAIARRVDVSTSVGRVDAFPEGGTVVPGHSQRFGLLVRDRDGAPTAADGRVLDDTGRCVTTFHTDRLGLATILVPSEEERRYEIAVDRPADVAERFALPGPQGHDFAVRVDPAPEGFDVEVRGTPQTNGEGVVVELVTATGRSHRRSVALRVPPPPKEKKGAGAQKAPAEVVDGDGRRLPVAHVRIPSVAAQGTAHVLVLHDDRAVAKRPFWTGMPTPVLVEIAPVARNSVRPRETIELDVVARRGATPVRADVAVSLFQGDASAMPNLAVRSLLEPQLGSEAMPPEVVASPSRRDAFLLVHGAYRLPSEGIEVPPGGLSPEAGRVEVPAIAVADSARRTGVDAAASRDDRPRRRTVVRRSKLERLLARAHFTRSARPVDSDYENRLLVPPRALLATPGLGREDRAPPQSIRVPSSRVDTRSTMFWSSGVRTGADGRARIRLTSSDVVGTLTWVAEGHAGSAALSCRGTIRGDAGFATKMTAPTHLHVGDTFDVMVAPRVIDDRKEELAIDVLTSSAIEPLLRTHIEYDPRRSARLHKFSFRVVAPSDDAEVRLVTQRGRYRETHRQRLRLLHREPEIVAGKSGKSTGRVTFTTVVPENAIPESVQMQASVSTGSFGRVLDWLRRILRDPTGCFEQFTSKNFVNLVTLDALLRDAEDPLLLERAHALARRGFARLLKHRDPQSGGFAFYPGGEPTARCTVTALRHLALYERIYKGLGRAELDSAIAWLEKRGDMTAQEALYLTRSLHAAGRTWKGSHRIVNLRPKSNYDRALLACCLATWPQDARVAAPSAEREKRRRFRDAQPLGLAAPDRPAPPKVAGDAGDGAPPESPHAARIAELLAELREANKKGSFDDGGSGVLGSRGGQLDIATLCLYGLALEAAGERDEAEGLLSRLARLQEMYIGTQSTALAIEAYTRLVTPDPGEVVEVKFTAPGDRPQLAAGFPNRVRPLRFRRAVAVEPGSTASMSLKIDARTPKPWTLGCSYRIRQPRSSPDAPFRLEVAALPKFTSGGKSTVRVVVTPAPDRELPTSQVVARIGLPGGCVIDRAAMDELAGESFSYWNLADGYVDLYWEKGIKTRVEARIPVRMEIPGTFTARPSFVRPYYESGREYFTAPLTIEILNSFGSTLQPEDARGPGNKPLRPRGR